MADDPNPALRAQLLKDIDDMARQIRGLPDIAATSVSQRLADALRSQLALRVRRRDLIQSVLDRLDVVVAGLAELQADGWPTPVKLATLDTELWTELQGEQSDVEAAVAVFEREQAAMIKVKLGEPEPKT